MKKIVLLFVLFATIAWVPQLFAQCAPAPRTGGTTFGYGVTDSITPGQFAPQPFIVCDNASLFYYGNNPDTIYLEGSAHLYVQSCFNLVVYMRNNCQLRCDTIQFLRVFREVIYDPTFTMFVDTSGSVFQAITSCPSMAYDYSAFPGGTSPCSTPTDLSNPSEAFALDVFPNPATETFHLRVPEEWREGSVLQIYGLDGREVGAHFIFGQEAEIDVSSFTAGSYLCRVMNGAKTLTRIVKVR